MQAEALRGSYIIGPVFAPDFRHGIAQAPLGYSPAAAVKWRGGVSMRASAYVRSCEKMHAGEQRMWVSLFVTAAIIVFIALQSLGPWG